MGASCSLSGPMCKDKIVVSNKSMHEYEIRHKISLCTWNCGINFIQEQTVSVHFECFFCKNSFLMLSFFDLNAISRLYGVRVFCCLSSISHFSFLFFFSKMWIINNVFHISVLRKVRSHSFAFCFHLTSTKQVLKYIYRRVTKYFEKVHVLRYYGPALESHRIQK